MYRTSIAKDTNDLCSINYSTSSNADASKHSTADNKFNTDLLDANSIPLLPLPVTVAAQAVSAVPPTTLALFKNHNLLNDNNNNNASTSGSNTNVQSKTLPANVLVTSLANGLPAEIFTNIPPIMNTTSILYK